MNARPQISPGVHGLRRRIELYPSSSSIDAGLEDDFHRFELRVAHADGVITGVDAKALRYPWSTCPGAGAFLAQEAVGRPLSEVAHLDPHDHCTHMFELVVLSAGHACDPHPTRFDMFVADHEGDVATALLFENGAEVLRWDIRGTTIEEPDKWRGLDLRTLSTWRASLSRVEAERAMLLRRALHISGGRQPGLHLPRRAVDRGASRMGACFTYQMPRAEEAFASPEWRRDFTFSSEHLLDGYGPSSG